MAAPDPTAIARAFLDAFGGACSSGNIASLKGLYGADSVASYDGTLVRGVDAIAASIITPRLTGGALVKWSRFDGQLTATNQLVILATGESAKPAGRFSQLFVLNSTPTGGMYVRVDIFRSGPGGTPNQVGADSTGMCSGFLQQYYTLYSSNRAGLASVYHAAKSQMAVEGKTAVGSAAIGPALLSLGAGRHEMATLDAVTCLDAGSPGAAAAGMACAAVALVTGRFTVEGQENPLAFSQAFLLAVEGATPFCANDIFSFNYA